MLEAFVYGVLGGLFVEIAGLWKLRHELKPDLPAYLKSWFYWLLTTSMILSGGVLASIYIKSGVELSPILSVNVGATAPLVIGSFTASAPNISTGS